MLIFWETFFVPLLNHTTAYFSGSKKGTLHISSSNQISWFPVKRHPLFQEPWWGLEVDISYCQETAAFNRKRGLKLSAVSAFQLCGRSSPSPKESNWLFSIQTLPISPGCLPNKQAQSDLCSRITCRQTRCGTFLQTRWISNFCTGAQLFTFCKNIIYGRLAADMTFLDALAFLELGPVIKSVIHSFSFFKTF